MVALTVTDRDDMPNDVRISAFVPKPLTKAALLGAVEGCLGG